MRELLRSAAAEALQWPDGDVARHTIERLVDVILQGGGDVEDAMPVFTEDIVKLWLAIRGVVDDSPSPSVDIMGLIETECVLALSIAADAADAALVDFERVRG